MVAPNAVQDDKHYSVVLRLPVKVGAKVIKTDHQDIVMSGAVIKQLAADAFETIVEAN